MRSVLIVSPDPEAGRVLSLAFELDGWETENVPSEEGLPVSPGADLVILDLVEGGKEAMSAIAPFRRSKGVQANRIIILPRGADEKRERASLPKTDVVIRRPYELSFLVQTAREICGKETARGRKQAKASRPRAKPTMQRTPKKTAVRKKTVSRAPKAAVRKKRTVRAAHPPVRKQRKR